MQTGCELQTDHFQELSKFKTTQFQGVRCTAGQKVLKQTLLSSSSCLHKVEHVAAADVRKLKYFMLKKTFSVGVLSDGAEYAYNSM